MKLRLITIPIDSPCYFESFNLKVDPILMVIDPSPTNINFPYQLISFRTDFNRHKLAHIIAELYFESVFAFEGIKRGTNLSILVVYKKPPPGLHRFAT